MEQQNLTSSIGYLRAGLFVLAATLLAMSWFMILRARWGRFDERQNDYRAIAEALRVQFFWTACGSGESVDHRYLQRQKNELSWIRAIVSSASNPVTADRKEFEALEEPQKLDRLRRIQRGWLEEQQIYFQRVTFELGRKLHWLHFFANTFLSAGVLMIFVGIAAHLLPWERSISTLAHVWGVFALPHALSVLFICFLVNELIASKVWRDGPEPSASSPDRVPADLMISTGFWKTLHGCSEKLTQSPWTVVAFGCLIGIASDSTIFGYSWNSVWFPSAAKLHTMLKNVYLAIAGLLHSWAAFHFLTHNVRRYSTMLGLYRGANHRMMRLLNTLEEQISHRASQAEQRKTVLAIQALLIELGVEALNENSEWLQMHRTTPIAPLMPVG